MHIRPSAFPVPAFIQRLLLCTTALLWLSACSEPPPAEKSVRPVKSMLVEDHHVARVIVLPAKVRAADKVDMAFQVPGKITELSVVNGQRVAKGTVLAALDSRDYESNLKAARAEYQRTQADYSRFKELVQRQLISKAEFDRQQALRDIAEANVEKAQKALDDTRLVAPFAGVVTQRYADAHEDVNAKQPVLSLQNMAHLEVVVQVPENAIPRDENIDTMRTGFDAFARFQGLPDRLFDLTMREFSLDADPRTQSYELVLEMAIPGNLSIYPGMSATVEATMPVDEDHHLLIPATAVFASATDNAQQFVWLVDTNTLTVQQRPVAIGSLLGDKIEIISGIEVGMRIVTAGVHYLAEGDVVRLLPDADGA